jgi:hypothetical protein
MLSATANRSAAKPLNALARALRWSVEGLRWWRRAPWMLLWLCLLQLLVEAVLQLIPWAGVTLSKLVVPLLVMGILLGLDDMAEGKRLRLACLAGCLRRGRFLPALGLAACWGLMVFGLQQLVAYMVYGPAAIDAVLFGHMAAHRELANLRFTRTLILPGVLFSTLLLPAPFLRLFRGLPPGPAIRDSVRIVLTNAAPFAWFALLNLLLFALLFATPWAMALILLLAPWLLATSYAIWRDVGSQVPLFKPAPKA